MKMKRIHHDAGQLLTALCFLTGSVINGNHCPDECRCDGTVYTVNCSYFTGNLSSLFESINSVTYTTWFHLSLSHNNITHLSELDISVTSTRFLRVLDLSFNFLHSTTLGDLPLAATTVLDLSHNAFTDVPSRFLGQLVLLESLDLSHNTVSTFSGYNISQTLKHLDLSHNNLTLLENDSFLGLWNLKSLDVSYNTISVLSAGILDYTSRLVSLNASCNLIYVIQTGVFTKKLWALHSVDMSHNIITEFEPWPYLPENLDYFNLSYNRMTKFSNHMNWEQDLSINVPELYRHSVDLRNNNFSRWIGEDLGKYHKDGKYTVYDFIHYGFDLSQNPWFCDCHFYQFVRDVQESFVAQSIPKMTCASPLHLHGASVLSLDTDVLVCNITERCPTQCHCQFRPSEGMTFVNCADRKLNVIPLELPGSVINLDISMNSLSYINWVGDMQRVVHLNLSQNMISNIEADIFKNMLKLLTIDLSFNKLQVLPQTIQLLPPESVGLADNHLLCTCDEIWLPEWLRLSNSSSDYEVFCLPSVDINRGTRVRDVTSSLLQCHRDMAIIISCSLSVLLFLCVAVSVVMVKFSYEVKVIVYKLFTFHPKDAHPSDTDATKLYDAYISCDEDDPAVMKLVKDVLLPRLEEDTNYSIFVPLRQMALGDSKADAIVESISSSRRVVALVTYGYLATGGWCLYEFDQAHKLLVEDGSGKCVVVLLEDIEGTDIQEEPLRSYITHKQYLRMKEKMFWMKLKYELPRKS